MELTVSPAAGETVLHVTMGRHLEFAVQNSRRTAIRAPVARASHTHTAAATTNDSIRATVTLDRLAPDSPSNEPAWPGEPGRYDCVCAPRRGLAKRPAGAALVGHCLFGQAERAPRIRAVCVRALCRHMSRVGHSRRRRRLRLIITAGRPIRRAMCAALLHAHRAPAKFN
jgi:hypothetical protein